MGERRSAIIIAATIAVIVGLALIFGVGYLGRDEAASEPLTEVTDAATIQNQVQLSHLGIATSENYAGQRIRVISANLKNTSDIPIRMIDVKMVFTDYDGKPVHEYAERVLRQASDRSHPAKSSDSNSGRRTCLAPGIIRVPITEVTKIGF